MLEVPNTGVGVTLIYIKGEDNVVADTFIWITMDHHSHKWEGTNLEEDTCEILRLGLLFIYDKTNCFSLDIE